MEHLDAAGEPGVRRMLEIFAAHIDDGLAFLGVTSLDELDPSPRHRLGDAAFGALG